MLSVTYTKANYINQCIVIFYNCPIICVCFCFCKASEIPTLGSTSNSLAIQNPSSAESAINALELEENQLSTVKKGDEKPNDNGSALERTYQNIKHGAQVKPFDNEPRSAGMTTGEEPMKL